MGSKYAWGYNPFQDFLLRSILYDVDVSTDDVENDIQAGFQYILENILPNVEDVVYLDFKIKNNDNNFEVIGKNAITSLWLLGIFPINIKMILTTNVFKIGDRKYKYNKKTYKLTYEEIKK